MIRHILDTLLEADSQPGDWYGGLTNQTGHAAAVGMPMSLCLLGTQIPPFLVPGSVAILYFLVWERLMQRGEDMGDSIMDAIHVGFGSLILTAAMHWGYWATATTILLWVILLGFEAYRRIRSSLLPP